ncbi:MAG TPA: Fe-S cluster assembly protein SufD [Steroidobacteraceae bacterium]|jgi:Fe-S cluster assembly protein SufD
MNAIVANSASAALERYRALFEARYSASDALTAMRRSALERFISAGFPTQRNEDWKYTNLRRLESRNFTAGNAAPIAADEALWIPGAGTRIVFVNGHAMPGLASAVAHPPGVTILTLAAWIENDPAAVATFLAQHAGTAATAFEDLNTAFSQDGVVIDIADGVALDQPIYVVHQWAAGSSLQMSHPRIIVRVGRNSRCSIIEHYVGSPEAETFTNVATSLEIAAGAHLTHYRIQQESLRGFHVGNVRAHLGRDSHYANHNMALGASIGRVDIKASLSEPGAHVSLSGLFAPDGTQHLDTHTLVDHIAPHTTSEEEYRGVADGRGRGVFNGKVIVRKDAQKIDAQQSNRNLLLSATAEIDTKPELEIYANDVKCSHGATTGQLDSTALFYLRSRGLSEGDARALLIRAFAESILTSIGHEPVHKYLEQHLHERYAQIGAVT